MNLPTCYILPDRPEQRAVLAVYRLLTSIINDALWLGGIASGDIPIPEEPLGVMIFPEPGFAEVSAAAESLGQELNDPKIALLDSKPLQDLLSLVGQLAGIIGENHWGDFLKLGAEAECLAQEVEDYLDAMLDHTFGKWGTFWFKLAVRHLPDEVFNSVEQEDVSVLRGILQRPPLIPKAGRVEPLSPLQRSILQALDGRGMKKTELAAAVCGSAEYGNLLYRPDGLKELRDWGLVKRKSKVGFYRPDRPPPGTIGLE